MSANGCSTSTGNIANNEFGNKNISGSIILKSKNNSQKRSANTIIKAHDNVAENEGYKMILPSTKGTAEQVLKIDSVTNDLLNLSWGEGGGGGGGSDITSDTYSQYSLETSQFSLLSGLTFDGGNFSKFFSNNNGYGLNNSVEFVRFSLSSYPQSFTWTPHSNEVHYPLTKVVMWTRNSSPTNDIEMFPTQFKIYGRPTAGSSTGETEIGNIILSSQPSRSENLLISSAAVNSVINTNKVVYNQYRIEIYENNSTSYSDRPLIGELRFYRPSSVQQYGNELTNWTENGAGHIIPSANSSYDIGSAEYKVRHLYLSSSSLNIGDVVLSSEGNDIKIGDNKLVKVTSEPIDGQSLIYSSNQWVSGSLRANHAYQQRDEMYSITLPQRASSGTGPINWQDVTDGTNTFSVTITPSSTNSKIELLCMLSYSQFSGNWKNRTVFGFKRGSSTYLLPTKSGNLTETISGGDYASEDTHADLQTTELRYFDTPNTTSPVTYTVIVGTEHNSSDTTFWWNRSFSDNDENWYNNGLSTFSAQEIDAAPQLSAVSTTGAQAGQALVYNSSNQWVPGLPVMPFFELFGLANSKTFSTNAYLTIVNSSGSTDVNMSGTDFGINKYGTSVSTTSNSVELLQDAVYKIDYSISLNYDIDVRFVYLQFQGASSANGTYSTVRTSVINTYEDITSSLDYSILSGSVLYSTTSTNRFLKFYLVRSSTVKIHSNTDIDSDISPVYNSIIFQRIK